MKTLYECLRDSDKAELIKLYLARHPYDFSHVENKEITVGEVFKGCRERLDELISELLGYEPLPNSDMVFFAVEFYENGYSTIEARLVSTKELEDDSPDTYGWDVTDREELLGYHVADTELTEKNLLEVLVNILHEATFWGYSSVEFEEGRKELFRSIEEAEEKEDDPDYWTSYTLEEFRNLLLPDKKKDPRADELEAAIRKAESDYDRYCLNRELAELRKLLAES